jgi:hypothetical protein
MLGCDQPIAKLVPFCELVQSPSPRWQHASGSCFLVSYVLPDVRADARLT